MGNEASQSVKGGDVIENNIEVKWKKIEGEFPGDARDGHCSASIGNKLYVFGGVCQTKNGESLETNQLITLDTESSTWNVINTTGSVPPSRSSATMAAVGTSLYLFGGLSQDCGWFEDVHRFDTDSSQWSVVKAEGVAPSPRDKLASSVIDNKIYVFGGFGPQMADDDTEDEEWEDEDEVPSDQQAAQFGWFDDLYVFDTLNHTWSQPLQMNLGGPSPRAAHSMCSVNKYLCVFGGRDAKARVNDLHIFNTESRKWEQACIRGAAPSPRSFHSATNVGSRVVVLGGRGTTNQHFSDLNIFDVETMQWLAPRVEGELPAGRGLHSACVVGEKLVLFGGSSNFSPETMQCHKYYKDSYYINTDDVLRGAAIATENQENVTSNIPQQKTDSKDVDMQKTEKKAPLSPSNAATDSPVSQ